ncbi:MAG: hypothetical protein ABSF23_13865 [Terracidiphilus sp.]|jgi:hypothetical protein
MTLLDAPKFDAARSRRKTLIVQCSAGAVLVLLAAWWLAASRPVDWPWNWNRYLFGRAKVNHFLDALEANDLPKAYGIWVNDKNWQQHPQQYATYPFERFHGDWGPNSPDNDYGAIHSHKIALAGHYGNGLLVAVLINGRKSGALNLAYDPKTGQLSFAPPGVSLYLGP